MLSNDLSITPERERVVSFPCSTLGWTGLVVQMTPSSETPVLLSSWCKSTKLPVLVNCITDPVDSGIISDYSVCLVDQDHFKILVGGVLIKPVRVQNSQSSQLSSCSLFCHRPQATLELELGDTLILGLPVYNTFGHWPLPPTTPYSNSVNNISLFGLVSKAARLIGTSWPSDPHNARKLPVLPTPHPLKKSHHIRLLLLP